MSIIITPSPEEVKVAISGAVDRAHSLGYADGKDDGYKQGFTEGVTSNDEQVFNEGYNQGYTDGYEDGNDNNNGYDDGYEDGKNEEIARVTPYVEKSKKAILGRGGEISSDAGIEALPEAIFNIPADSSLAFYEDEEIAYQKTVPNGAEEYALLKQLGGMTYKCKNLIPYPYVHTTKTMSGITFTDNGDGSLTITGTASASAVFILQTNAKYGDTAINAMSSESSTNGLYTVSKRLYYNPANGILSVNIASGDTLEETIYPMLNEGGVLLPHEPYYEGLRDTKVAEIVSVGANLFDASKIKNTRFEVSEDGSAIKLPIVGSNGYTGTNTTLGELCPSLKVGNKIVIDFEASGTNTTKSIYLAQAKLAIPRNTSAVITQEHLASEVVMYGTHSNKGDTEQVTITDFRVNLGTVSSPYTPYREPITYPIPEEVQVERGVNENYRDYIEFKGNRVLKHNNCGIATLNGSETWLQYPNVENTYYANIPNKAKGYQTSMCSDFNNVNMAWVNGKVGDYSDSPTTTYVYFKTVYSSIEDWKAHLAEKPIELAYAVAEPNTEDVTDLFTNFDNFLSVEGGGTLEFVNEHSNAVPSTVKYTVKVGG